jgi:Zn-dependent protease
MGGLAIPGSNNVWSQSGVQRLRSNQQIIVSLAGPVFGFMLAGLLIGLVYLLGGRVEVIWAGVLPDIIPVLPGGNAGAFTGTNPALWLFLMVGIWANVFWNILNLMPVFPLDGGQVARELFTQSDPGNGVRNSLYLSIGFAIAIAVFGFSRDDKFMGFFFAYMAFMSFQTLQMNQGGGFGGRRPW